MGTVSLAQDGWRVELAPEIGGSISLCNYDGQDVLRPAPSTAREARDMSCFPLVPFSNRIKLGVFEFQGRRVALPRNMGDHPHALHGQGWRAAWQAEAQANNSATLMYSHEPDAWPWRYDARQEFSLTPDSLIVRLGITNLAESPMPAGLGLHPYFPRSEGVTLTTGLSHIWEATGEQIPTRLLELPPKLDFSQGLEIANLDLDHCFAGWNRKAVVDWPGRPYRLHMEGGETLKHLVIYTPQGADFFCAEGVENMNDGFNWMASGVDTGAHVLAPGESHDVTTVFRVEPAAG
jgi:aldose 1-epimerase